MRLVCLSDTHGRHEGIEVPEGDILLHAGDISQRGKPDEISAFDHWLGTLPHPHKVMIAGNHDFLFERQPALAKSLLTHAVYLNDSGIELAGIKIWGSPISPWFYDWAFNRQRGAEIRQHWDLIPNDTDILITHGPPFGILDLTKSGESVGCHDLLAAVQRVQPRLHLFGHIHEAYGQCQVDETWFVNASNLDFNYRPVHPVTVIDWPLTTP